MIRNFSFLSLLFLVGACEDKPHKKGLNRTTERDRKKKKTWFIPLQLFFDQPKKVEKQQVFT